MIWHNELKTTGNLLSSAPDQLINNTLFKWTNGYNSGCICRKKSVFCMRALPTSRESNADNDEDFSLIAFPVQEMRS